MSLFLELCEYSGIISEVPTRKPDPKVDRSPKPLKVSQTGVKKAVPPKPPADPPPIQHGLTAARDRYVELLLSKLDNSDADPELLDRIERALEIVDTGRGDST